MPREYLIENYSYSFDPVTLSSEYATKNYRQRALYVNPDTIFNVTESLTASEFASFQAFVDGLDYGANSFTANYFDGGLERTATGYIVRGEYSYVYNSPNEIEVSYQLEIRNRDLTSGQTLYDIFVAGVPFDSDYLRQVELTVNGV